MVSAIVDSRVNVTTKATEKSRPFPTGGKGPANPIEILAEQLATAASERQSEQTARYENARSRFGHRSGQHANP
jgi:hypothetical protein